MRFYVVSALVAAALLTLVVVPNGHAADQIVFECYTNAGFSKLEIERNFDRDITVKPEVILRTGKVDQRIDIVVNGEEMEVIYNTRGPERAWLFTDDGAFAAFVLKPDMFLRYYDWTQAGEDESVQSSAIFQCERK